MKIVGMNVLAVEGGHHVSITGFLPSTHELDADDTAWLVNQMKEYGAEAGAVSRDAVPEKETEAAPNAPRRRRASTSADAGSAPTGEAGAATSASNAGTEQPTPRRRRASATEGDSTQLPASSSAPAGGGDKKIGNLDLAKAMTKLAETVGKDDAMAFLKDEYGVEKAADIAEDKRAGFLAAVREVTG